MWMAYVCAQHTSSAMRESHCIKDMDWTLKRPNGSPYGNNNNTAIVSHVSSLYLVGLYATPENIIYFRLKPPKRAFICTRRHHTDLSGTRTYLSYCRVHCPYVFFPFTVCGRNKSCVRFSSDDGSQVARTRRKTKAKKFYSCFPYRIIWNWNKYIKTDGLVGGHAGPSPTPLRGNVFRI